MWGGTFEKLVNLLRGFLEKRDRHFRKVTPVKKRVVVTFLRLANGILLESHSESQLP